MAQNHEFPSEESKEAVEEEVEEAVTAAEEPVITATPTALPPKSSTPTRSRPKWETTAYERVRAAIKKFNKPLADLVQRDANEGDTRLLVTDFLCYGLGFDKYSDLTTEYQVKGEFADYGIRLDKQLVAFVEVKRVATKLNTKHLRQVQNYALNEGVEWVILTNGVEWQVYHITAALPVEMNLAFTVDLLGEDTVTQKANHLFYLTRESLQRRQVDELWQTKRATSPKSLARIISSERVVDAIRKELKSTTGFKVENKEIVRLLSETVFNPECLEVSLKK